VSEIAKNNGVVSNEKYSFYDAAGNVIKDSSVSAAGVNLRTYEYYLDKVSTVENPNFGVSYAGPGNKNSLKKITIKSPTNVVTVSNYAVPEFDAQGRVVKQAYSTGTTNAEFSYSY
jgi:hypothetical protein